jgi:SAM-dependent methyltransferase
VSFEPFPRNAALIPRHPLGPERRSVLCGLDVFCEESDLHTRAFDELASAYDGAFTETAVGRALRALVWMRFNEVFAGSSRILDLGCGTGEDALRLASIGKSVVATDASPRMIQIARHKAAKVAVKPSIRFHCAPMEQLGALDGEHFDGVLSNFGAVNCVGDLRGLVADVATRLRPGAGLLWVVMGRHVPWEWLWYLGRGQWAKAWRRLQPEGTEWRGMKIHYPTPATLATLLRPHFEVRRVAPLGLILPPTYAAEWFNRQPRVLNAMVRIERWAQRSRVLASLSDHYIIEARRRETIA